jgi:hypothetical protein
VGVVGWLGAAALALALMRSRRSPRCEEPVPASLLHDVEVLRLETSDGADIGAWFLEASKPDAPTVIELHGKGGARGVRLAPRGSCANAVAP